MTKIIQIGISTAIFRLSVESDRMVTHRELSQYSFDKVVHAHVINDKRIAGGARRFKLRHALARHVELTEPFGLGGQEHELLGLGDALAFRPADLRPVLPPVHIERIAIRLPEETEPLVF